MPVYDLYSKRQKRLRGEEPDVYKYGTIPLALRNQIIWIMRNAIGVTKPPYKSYSNDVYNSIDKILCREYGLLKLTYYSDLRYQESVESFFLQCRNTNKVLDVIEITFTLIDNYVRENFYQTKTDTKITPDEAIKELNQRFQERRVGYRFESGRIIRIDSLLIHSEVVKPTLELLKDKEYQGANEEFLKAHEHYRHERYKECLTECLKAFESVMKTICEKHSWPYGQNDTVSKLLDICFSNDLIPNYLQSHFNSLQATLRDGVPTVRSKRGAHGQGTKQIVVPQSLAGYVLHLAATNILFLIQSEQELSKRHK